MSALRRLGWLFARLIAVVVILLSAWMLIVNLVEISYDGWILVWILASGLIGTIGGILYLVSIDGPDRFRTRIIRTGGWAAMLFSMVLPTSLSFFLLPLVAVLFPTLIITPNGGADEPITSS